MHYRFIFPYLLIFIITIPLTAAENHIIQRYAGMANVLFYRKNKDLGYQRYYDTNPIIIKNSSQLNKFQNRIPKYGFSRRRYPNKPPLNNDPVKKMTIDFDKYMFLVLFSKNVYIGNADIKIESIEENTKIKVSYKWKNHPIGQQPINYGRYNAILIKKTDKEIIFNEIGNHQTKIEVENE